MTDGTCKHYNGTFHNTHCEAGVCYRDVTPEPNRLEGSALRIPCISVREGLQPAQLEEFQKRGKCDKFEERTAEEIAAEEAAWEKRFETTIKAREAIVAHLGGPWKRGTPGASGKIPCPVCQTGELRFSRAGINGHIHAGCTTENCVSWFE